MSRKRLTRRERPILANAALSSLISGTAKALVSWLLNQLAS